MTVATDNNRKVSVTNGVTTAFPFTFQLLAEGDFKARHYPDVGSEVDLVISTNFTLSTAPWEAGGTMTTVGTPLAAGTVVMYRDMDYLQDTDLENNRSYNAVVYEKALDNLTLLVQQVKDDVDRAIKADISVPVGVDYSLPAPEAGSFMQWNVTEDGFINVNISALGDLVATTAFTESLLDDADADAFWVTLMATIAKATARASLGAAGLTDSNAMSGDNAFSGDNSHTGTETFVGASPFVLEGATVDANETTLAVEDPTSDNILTFPDKTGILATTEELFKLPTVTGTVAGNDLTAGFLGHTLDFRHATLSNGAVTTIQFGDLTLVVPDGATLGAIDTQLTRVVLLAINNAGTVEPAIVNIAGGVNLNEEGVISTTALSAASDASNVIYSTTARSNVAYKVVGILEFTQAVAGTYATTPSLKQGAGGNALTAMSSLGYGQTWQSVTRASGVTYYNETGKPIYLKIDAVSTTAGGGVGVDLTVNGVAYGKIAAVSNAAGSGYKSIGTAIIPPGMFYVVTDANTTHTSYEVR